MILLIKRLEQQKRSKLDSVSDVADSKVWRTKWSFFNNQVCASKEDNLSAFTLASGVGPAFYKPPMSPRAIDHVEISEPN